MVKNAKKCWILSAGLLVLFLLVMLCVKTVDVQPIGPNGSVIGLAAINAGVRDLFGQNMVWYDITDLFGVLSILSALGFALLALCQLIKRRSLLKVDRDLILLGVFYAAVLVVYVFFEIFVINYRPILMDGQLEASFPSSHTMLVCCFLVAAIWQFANRISNHVLRCAAIWVSAAIIVVTVVGRLICGVHWFSDILAGLLASGALVAAYIAACKTLQA